MTDPSPLKVAAQGPWWRRVQAPILTVREQVLRHGEAIGMLLDLGASPAKIADVLGGIEIEPSLNVGRTRYKARWLDGAPELSVFGDTIAEARVNLVQRLRYYDPDD